MPPLVIGRRRHNLQQLEKPRAPPEVVDRPLGAAVIGGSIHDIDAGIGAVEVELASGVWVAVAGESAPRAIGTAECAPMPRRTRLARDHAAAFGKTSSSRLISPPESRSIFSARPGPGLHIPQPSLRRYVGSVSSTFASCA